MEALLLKIMQGESLNLICKEEGMPSYETVCRWLISTGEDHLEFREQFRQAMSFRKEMLEDKILEISDDASDDKAETDKGAAAIRTHFQRCRQKIDARKWLYTQHQKELKALEKEKQKQQEKEKKEEKETGYYVYNPISDEPLQYGIAAEVTNNTCYIPLKRNEHQAKHNLPVAPCQKDPGREGPYNNHPALQTGLRWQQIHIENHPRFLHPGENIRYFMPVRAKDYVGE
jgi:hypothetical protein